MLSDLERSAVISLKDKGLTTEEIAMFILLSRLMREHPTKMREEFELVMKQVAVTTSLLG